MTSQQEFLVIGCLVDHGFMQNPDQHPPRFEYLIVTAPDEDSVYRSEAVFFRQRGVSLANSYVVAFDPTTHSVVAQHARRLDLSAAST